MDAHLRLWLVSGAGLGAKVKASIVSLESVFSFVPVPCALFLWVRRDLDSSGNVREVIADLNWHNGMWCVFWRIRGTAGRSGEASGPDVLYLLRSAGLVEPNEETP